MAIDNLNNMPGRSTKRVSGETRKSQNFNILVSYLKWQRNNVQPKNKKRKCRGIKKLSYKLC